MRSSHHWVTGWLSPQGCRLTAQHSTRTFRSPCRARGRRRCRTTPQCFEPRRACAQFLILMREDLHCRSSLRGPAMCVWVGECWRTCAYVRTPPTRRASCACAPLRPNSSLHEQCDGARTPPPLYVALRRVYVSIRGCVSVCACMWAHAFSHCGAGATRGAGGAHTAGLETGITWNTPRALVTSANKGLPTSGAHHNHAPD